MVAFHVAKVCYWTEPFYCFTATLEHSRGPDLLNQVFIVDRRRDNTILNGHDGSNCFTPPAAQQMSCHGFVELIVILQAHR